MGITIRASKLPGLVESMKQYSKFNKRAPSEVVNAKLTFIAINATNTTKQADPSSIVGKLKTSSRKYPNVPLDAILVQVAQRNQGKPGLTGAKMARAVEKYDKRAISRVKFLSAIWKTAISIMDSARQRGDAVFSNRFKPKQATGLKLYGNPKGGAQYAKAGSVKCSGYIENKAGAGKQSSPTVQGILASGLKDAVYKEIQSINAYVQRKYDAQIQKLFKK